MPADELRLYLALWPPASVVKALQAHARLWRWPAGARVVPPERLHLTLHFIGAVAASRLDELRSGLAVPCVALDVDLDAPRRWPGGIAVLGSSGEPPAQLQALQHRLGQALLALGLPCEQRPFRPHVTLARAAGAARPPASAPPVRWDAPAGYVLVQSLPAGGGCRTVARFGESGLLAGG